MDPAPKKADNWVPPELAGMFAQRASPKSAGAGLFDDDDAIPNDISGMLAQTKIDGMDVGKTWMPEDLMHVQ